MLYIYRKVEQRKAQSTAEMLYQCSLSETLRFPLRYSAVKLFVIFFDVPGIIGRKLCG
jgi:hypothetical protein